MKNELKRILSERNIIPLHLAAALGCSPTTIYNIVNEITATPDLGVIAKICSYLNISVVELFPSLDYS